MLLQVGKTAEIGKVSRGGERAGGTEEDPGLPVPHKERKDQIANEFRR
jgi:hypothetical protein